MHKIKLNQPQLGHQIRRVRRHRNLSQVALAKLLGISQETVSRVESGGINKGKSIDLLRRFLADQSEVDDDLPKIIDAIGASEELRSLIIRILKERGDDA